MLKYKIVTEKLDPNGKVVRAVRDFEDGQFDIDVGNMLSDFIAKGELNFDLAEVKFNQRDFMETAVPCKMPSCSFCNWEPGLTMIVSEFIPSISAQFVVYDAVSCKAMYWKRTEADLSEKARIS